MACWQPRQQKGDRYHQAVALLNLGYGQLVQKRYDAALTWLERVLAFSDLRDLTDLRRRTEQRRDLLLAPGTLRPRHHRAASRPSNATGAAPAGSTSRRSDSSARRTLDAGKDREGVPYLRQALGRVASDAGLCSRCRTLGGKSGRRAHQALTSWTRPSASTTRRSDSRQRQRPERHRLQHVERRRDCAAHRAQLADATRLFAEALATSPTIRAFSGRPTKASRRWRWPAKRRVPDAMRHFAAALDTIEKTRSDLMRTDYKLSYLTRLIDFYRVYVDALVDQGQIERALEIADSSRGRVLAERQGVTSPAGLRPGSLRKTRGRIRHGVSLVLARAGAFVLVGRDAGARPALHASAGAETSRRSSASTRPPSTTSCRIR